MLIQNEPWMSQWQSEHEIEPDSKSEPEWAGRKRETLNYGTFCRNISFTGQEPKNEIFAGRADPAVYQHCIW